MTEQDTSQAPPRVLRGFTIVIVDVLATLVAIRAFGLLFGLGGVLAIDFVVRPRESRQRSYIAIAAAIGVIVVGSTTLYRQMNALRVWEGVKSPPLAFTTIDGARIRSEDFKGKRVALNFWATWCGPCQMEIPEINRLYVDKKAEDVAVFGISNESEAKIREFLAEHKVDYPLVSLPDANLPLPYGGITAVPTTFVLDRNGVIQSVRSGYIGADELREIIWEADDYGGEVKAPPPGAGER